MSSDAYDMVIPLAVRPEQLRSARPPRPEQRLALAVLRQGLQEMRRFRTATSAKGRRLHREAAQWFASDDRSSPFSFENVCDALGFPADKVRRAVLAPGDTAPQTSRRAA